MDLRKVGCVGAEEAGVGRIILELGVFEKGLDRVETEAGDALVQPKLHGGKHLPLDGGISPVEVGLLLEKGVVIELLTRRNPLPSGATKEGVPVVGRNDLAGEAGVSVRFLLVGEVRCGGGNPVVPYVPVGLGIGAGTGALSEK